MNLDKTWWICVCVPGGVRSNQILKRKMGDRRCTWRDALPFAILGIRTTTSREVPPYEMVYGQTFRPRGRRPLKMANYYRGTPRTNYTTSPLDTLCGWSSTFQEPAWILGTFPSFAVTFCSKRWGKINVDSSLAMTHNRMIDVTKDSDSYSSSLLVITHMTSRLDMWLYFFLGLIPGWSGTRLEIPFCILPSTEPMTHAPYVTVWLAVVSMIRHLSCFLIGLCAWQGLPLPETYPQEPLRNPLHPPPPLLLYKNSV